MLRMGVVSKELSSHSHIFLSYVPPLQPPGSSQLCVIFSKFLLKSIDQMLQTKLHAKYKICYTRNSHTYKFYHLFKQDEKWV
jgi:hypothetical protein